MEDQLITDYLERLEYLQRHIHQAVDPLPEAALDWVPGQDMNSVAVLLAHTAGSLRFWIGDVVDQTPSGRDRAAEFKVKNVGWDVLKSRLDENLKYIRGALEKLSLANLAETRLSRDGRTVTVAWALLHAVEHSSLHLGHIEVTSQMWTSTQHLPNPQSKAE